jgi:hypothetical protein
MAVAGFLVVTAVFGMGVAASAQDSSCVPAEHAGVPICDPSDPPSVSATNGGRGTQVAGTQVSRGGLPVTGGDIAGMVGLGGAAVLVGLAFRQRARRMASVDSLAPTS